MKKAFILILVFPLIIGACIKDESEPFEGAWKRVYSKYPSMEESFPAQITGSGVKVWTKGGFAFAGEYQLDTVKIDAYGWGTYKISEGIRYEESMIFHHTNPRLNGQTLKMHLELRNDTLIQSWPADEDWNLEEDFYVEKYIRLK